MPLDLARAQDAIPVVQSTADRTARFPIPNDDQRVFNKGTSQVERYSVAANGWLTDFAASGTAMTINVTSPLYGAKGDGTTDDTAAIQAAITAAQGLNYNTVYFPQPSVAYKVTSTLTVSGPIRLAGAHEGVAIKAVGMAANTFLLDINGGASNLEHVVVESLMLVSDNNLPDLVRLNHAAVCTFQRVRLFNARHAVTISGSRGHDNFFHRVEVYGITGNGFYFTGFTGGGQETFLGCSVTSANFGIVVDATSTVTQLSVLGTLFELCAGAGISTPGTVHGLAMTGCRFEKNAVDLDVRPSSGNSVYGLAVHGNFFNSNNVDHAITIGGNTGTVRGFSIQGNYAEVYSAYFILLNGEGMSGTIMGNRVHSCPAIINTARIGVLVANNEGDAGVLGATLNPPLLPVSADRGDASVTLTVAADSTTQRFATTLTANRTVTLPATANNGDRFRIVRTGLGAFTLAVGSLKTIPSATAAFVDVEYDGSAWQLAAYGTL